MNRPRQAVVTVASGIHAEKLDKTFISFAQNPFLELHAFIIGSELPSRQLPGIFYHLEAPDHSFSHEMRDIYYRRLIFVDQLEVDYALIVDNSDVLCVQPLPEFPQLMRGASVAACTEHAGSRYLAGQGYTSAYINAGITFWHVPTSAKMRAEIVERGRTCFRSIEDQLTLNEVLHTCYYEQLILLPSQYNYRACLAPKRIRGWPTVTHLDGVMLYHNSHCIDAAKKLIPVKSHALLTDLPRDERPLTRYEQFWRKVRNRFEPHWVK
ncbi:MAG: hypothetical protein HY043_19870 [Verrucomicrobia bacterium]|nr:hypothetical protein [Verrucomicrobiota bacterium]